jgi:hypothetical protein
MFSKCRTYTRKIGEIVEGVEYTYQTKRHIYIVETQPIQNFFAIDYKWCSFDKNKNWKKIFKKIMKHFKLKINK